MLGAVLKAWCVWGAAKAGVIPILVFGGVSIRPESMQSGQETPCGRGQVVEKRKGMDAGGRVGWKKQGNFAYCNVFLHNSFSSSLCCVP